MKMDGTESHKEFLKDFDHHEKVVRSPHEFVPTKNASVEAHEASGYKPVKPAAPPERKK